MARGIQGAPWRPWALSLLPPRRIYSQNSFAHPLLTAGTPYWLILQPDPSDSTFYGAWFDSSPVVFGPWNVRDSPSGNWTGGFTSQSAFEILGTAAVPEPSTLTLCAIAVVGLLGYAWRRRKLAAA